MTARRHPVLVRDAEAGRNTELFFVAAIATLLAIRGFLAATGYPQLGGRSLHIAHMLWGGLTLAAAFLLLLVSIGRRSRPLAAILGGAGFGIFIDELGKFLTRDSNYFYRPAIALIYFIFVGLFLVVRATLARRALTADERLANAITIMRDMALEDLDVDEKAQAAALLDACDPRDPRVTLLRGILAGLATVPVPPPGRIERMRRWLLPRIARTLESPRFPRTLAALLLVQAFVGIGRALATGQNLFAAWRSPSESLHLDVGVVSWGEIISSSVSIALVLVGMARLMRSRMRAYRMFRRSIRIAVFVTQFFVFYDAQLAGVVWLAFNVILLAALDYLIAHEVALTAERAAPASRPRFAEGEH